jgi:hypothetical protein
MARVLVLGLVCLTGCGYPALARLSDDTAGDAPVDASASADAPATDATCATVHATATKVAPTVELLLDQSGSMGSAYGSTTRWAAMVDALSHPGTGLLPTLASKVYFGATLFSAPSNGPPCPQLITVPRKLDNAGPIATMLQGQTPFAETPTPESIKAVRDDFQAMPPVAGSPPIIVLATDGLPNTCDMRNPMTPADQDMANRASVSAAQNAYASGIKLFILFVGAVDASDHPQQMANAGAGLDPATGNATVYRASDPAQLAAAFQLIIDGVRTCDLTLDTQVELDHASSGVVTLNGAPLSFGIDWALDRDGRTVHLVGNACTTLKNAVTSTLDGTFPCTP